MDESKNYKFTFSMSQYVSLFLLYQFELKFVELSKRVFIVTQKCNRIIYILCFKPSNYTLNMLNSAKAGLSQSKNKSSLSFDRFGQGNFKN